MKLLTSNLLKNLRTYLGLSQDQIATRFNLGDRNTVSRYEKTRVLPREILSKIQEQFESQEELDLLLFELKNNSDYNSQDSYNTTMKGKNSEGRY